MDAPPKISFSTTYFSQLVVQLVEASFHISLTTSSMIPTPTIKSATVRFIKNKQVCFNWDLLFQNTITVTVFAIMIISDSTPNIKIFGSELLHMLGHILERLGWTLITLETENRIILVIAIPMRWSYSTDMPVFPVLTNLSWKVKLFYKPK